MGKSSDGVHDAMCTACEMAVVWMQNKLRRNETEEQILDYVNEVNYHSYASWKIALLYAYSSVVTAAL